MIIAWNDSAFNFLALKYFLCTSFGKLVVNDVDSSVLTTVSHHAFKKLTHRTIIKGYSRISKSLLREKFGLDLQCGQKSMDQRISYWDYTSEMKKAKFFNCWDICINTVFCSLLPPILIASLPPPNLYWGSTYTIEIILRNDWVADQNMVCYRRCYY